MRALELAARLADDAENVAKYLLPNGKRRHREWLVGSVNGEAGESLKVCIDGSKAGVWSDFQSAEAGDLIGLWMATRSVDLFTACSEAMRWLGIEEKKLEPHAQTYAKPAREGVKALHDLPLHWLTKTRGLSLEAVKAYCVAVKGSAVMFPYLRDGELIFAKYRKWGAKEMWTDKDCEPCLFGWQAIHPSARAVTICEGELDALTLFDYGIPALSVPFGGGTGEKQRWIDREFDRLARYDEIFLCLDMDKAGQEATAEIAHRLGRERCKVVSLPHNDANACLLAGMDRAAMQKLFLEAKTQDPDTLKQAADYADEVWREFQYREHGEKGIRLPWAKAQDRMILRSGEVSIWAGISGHGKSQVIGDVMLGAIQQGYRGCVASMEFKPSKMLARLQCQTAAKRYLAESESRAVSSHWRDKLWVFDVTGTAKAAAILEVFAYASKRYGIKLFVLDNLSKCGFADDDYSGSKIFIDQLTDLARTMDIHIAVVHHVRKTDSGEERPPRKGDIKGSGGISDMADTVVIVWRNKPKERELRELHGAPASVDLRAKPDCIIECVKQRHGDSEPTLLLWFHPGSYRYLDSSGMQPEPLLEFAPEQVQEDTGIAM